VTAWRIPFNRPVLTGRELEYIQQALDGGQLSGDGPFGHRCEELLEEALGVQRALLTTSGTHALELAGLLLDLEPGDEVIVPSFSFVSTASAFALRGAKIVFADVRADTLNLDETRVADLITGRTRAIVAVHYAGVACALDALGELVKQGGLALVEDNAHGLFGSYHGRPLGTFGALAAQSFHETKNFTCGEGGALLVNDPALVERAEILREKGTDRKLFMEGRVDKYTWVDLGSSYVLSDLQAAFLAAQLESREAVQHARKAIWHRYRDELGEWAEQTGTRLPFVPAGCEPSYHMFYVVLPSADARRGLADHLGRRGILAVFHFLPLNVSRMGARHAGRPGQCPVAEDVSERLLRLPFYTSLSEREQAEVIDAVLELEV
jgi:dTDP-4-amino-4,6-dideoxygalactose transaminase